MINFLEDIKMRHNRSDVRLPNSRYFQISRVARDQTFEIFSSPDFILSRQIFKSINITTNPQQIMAIKDAKKQLEDAGQ